jgi:hypothetical protein
MLLGLQLQDSGVAGMPLKIGAEHGDIHAIRFCVVVGRSGST